MREQRGIRHLDKAHTLSNNLILPHIIYGPCGGEFQPLLRTFHRHKFVPFRLHGIQLLDRCGRNVHILVRILIFEGYLVLPD